jgi:protein TonB
MPRPILSAMVPLAFVLAASSVAAQTAPVRVGYVASPAIASRVDPVYPDAAHAAGVAGTVRVQVEVNVDGTVQDVQLVTSIPLLDQAALDAVRQWTFKPTLLNGKPTAAVMEIDVNVPNIVRVGGAIRAPIKIAHADPIYPPEAQAAGIQGIVILELMISPEGRVEGTRVLRSVPALDDAASAAVRQWMFTPTLLNGVPTWILYNVTVTFQTRQ